MRHMASVPVVTLLALGFFGIQRNRASVSICLMADSSP